MSRNSQWIILVAFLWLAFGFRMWGLDFGLPYQFHPDEHQYVDVALEKYTTGQFDVGLINPPLFTYVLALAYWPWITFNPFVTSDQWIASAYFFARLWNVTFSMLTVALMYPLGQRLYRKKTGKLGLVLLAGLFLPGREAHFAVNDTILTFFVLLTIHLSIGLYKGKQFRFYLCVGTSAGLAMAAKLTGVLVILTVFVAHLFALDDRASLSFRKLVVGFRAVRWWLSVGIMVFVFLLVSVHIFGQLPQFLESIIEHFQFGVEGYKGLQMTPTNGWIFYIQVLGWGMGWLVLFTAAIVVGQVFWRRNLQGIIVAIFAIALFVYMGAQKNLFARFLLPAVPPLVILVALGLSRLEEKWLLLQQKPIILWPVIIALLLVQPLINTIWFDYLLSLPDTRQLATAWFTEQFADDTVVAKEGYSILPTTLFGQDHWPYKILYLDERGPTRNNIDHYLTNKTEIIALSNYIYGRVRADKVEEQARIDQISFLEQNATLIKEFNPYRQPDYANWFNLDQIYGPAGETLQRVSPGPHIKIYRLPYENQPYSQDTPPISVPVNANFGGKLILLGYDLPARRVEPGGSLLLTLYWQAVSRMDETYVMFNHLLDGKQRNWGGYDRWPQETAKTTLWHSGEIVVDAFNLPVSVDAPDGVYTIDIGLYNQDDLTATPLPILRDGIPIAENSIRIGPIKVGGAPPEVVLSSSKVDPTVSLSVELGEPPVILLRGYDLTQSANTLKLNLYWESLASTSVDWSVFAHIRNHTGEVVAQKDGPAGNGRYPSSLWDTSDIIVDEIVIPVGDLSDADYDLYIGLYDLSTGKRLQVKENLADEILLLDDLSLK